jgi:hypothetical protein
MERVVSDIVHDFSVKPRLSSERGNVTIVDQDSPDKYTTVATVDTFHGEKTITVDPVTHNAYFFQPERGPAPAMGGRSRGPQGLIVASWFIVIKQ